MMTCCTLWLFSLLSQPDGSTAMSGGVLLIWKFVPCKHSSLTAVLGLNKIPEARTGNQ
jgi:hypothetical protein